METLPPEDRSGLGVRTLTLCTGDQAAQRESGTVQLEFERPHFQVAFLPPEGLTSGQGEIYQTFRKEGTTIEQPQEIALRV